MNRRIILLAALLAVCLLVLLLLLPKGEPAGEDRSEKKTGPVTLWVPPDIIEIKGTAHTIPGFPEILQMPELPTGCEVTALDMVLQYLGYDVDKTTLAEEYLPTVDSDFFYGEDGILYGPDMLNYFVGDPFTEAGYICGAPAICTAAERYLEDQGGGHTAQNLTGAAPEELYELVAKDVPVLVWVSIDMEDRSDIQGWYTEDGEYIEWCTQDHGAVLIGFSEEGVTIADPITGIAEYDREQFESVFESRGRQCVIISGDPGTE